MAQPAYEVAQHSYARCLRDPDFFAILYDALLASDPRVPPMFEDTAFPRQHKLLQHGLGLLLSYAKEPDDALLQRIAARHSRAGIDVPPDMYRHFVSSLLVAVGRTDPRFDDEIESAWLAAARPGLDFMKSRYQP